jgi:hypothetical protein
MTENVMKRACSMDGGNSCGHILRAKSSEVAKAGSM